MNQQNTKEALVIHYFLTEKNNSDRELAEKTGVQISRVSNILAKYLKNKVVTYGTNS